MEFWLVGLVPPLAAGHHRKEFFARELSLSLSREASLKKRGTPEVATWDFISPLRGQQMAQHIQAM